MDIIEEREDSTPILGKIWIQTEDTTLEDENETPDQRNPPKIQWNQP
jgi:hypothetical protein